MNDFVPIIKGYINQNFSTSIYLFNVTDGLFHLKRKTSTNINHYTTPYGSTPVDWVNNMSERPWIEFKEGDTVTTFLHVKNVTTSGQLAIQGFDVNRKDWLITFVNASNVEQDTDYTATRVLAKDGIISGFNLYSTGSELIDAYFTIEIYRNGIRVV